MHPAAAHPSAEPPIKPEHLPGYSSLMLDAIMEEHKKSVDVMGQTLFRTGWTPEQVAHVGRKWPWTWVAKAVGLERERRGEPPAKVEIMRRLWAESSEGKLAAEIDAEERRVTVDVTERPAPDGSHAIVF